MPYTLEIPREVLTFFGAAFIDNPALKSAHTLALAFDGEENKFFLFVLSAPHTFFLSAQYCFIYLSQTGDFELNTTLHAVH